MSLQLEVDGRVELQGCSCSLEVTNRLMIGTEMVYVKVSINAATVCWKDGELVCWCCMIISTRRG